jgi:hypothetical protein
VSFTRQLPSGGLPLAGQLTSAELNQIDIDHANALDKSPAGDTLSGQVSIQPGAGSPGIFAGVGGSLGGPTIALGFPFGGDVPSLAIGVPAGLVTTAAGAIQLNGGANDNITFSTPRFDVKSRPIAPLGGLYQGWVQSIRKAISNNSDTTGQGFVVPLDGLHNGATLTGVIVNFAVGQPHPGAPANPPTLRIQRIPLALGVGAPPQYQDLSSTAVQTFPMPSTGAAWYANGAIQFFVYSCNQNNVIDTANYEYLMAVVDESGQNALFGQGNLNPFISGNLYFGYTLVQGSIIDMRFQ